jgi:hypothetical protein
MDSIESIATEEEENLAALHFDSSMPHLPPPQSQFLPTRTTSTLSLIIYCKFIVRGLKRKHPKKQRNKLNFCVNYL